MTVSVDGARYVAIRSTDAGSECARDGVTVGTGTVTGSGRKQCVFPSKPQRAFENLGPGEVAA